LLPTQAAFDRQQLTQDVRISTKNTSNSNGKNYNSTANSAQLWTAKNLGNPDNIMPAVWLSQQLRTAIIIINPRANVPKQ